MGRGEALDPCSSLRPGAGAARKGPGKAALPSPPGVWIRGVFQLLEVQESTGLCSGTLVSHA